MLNFDDTIKQLRVKREEYATREIKGKRLKIPFVNEETDVIVYGTENPLKSSPVFFNLHGGAWIGGDAVLMESFCLMLAKEINGMVVNINYKKLDERPFPYQQEEVKNTVLYFASKAEEYGVDKNKFILSGCSAGGHIAAGSALLLSKTDFRLAAQVLIYPFLAFDAEAKEETHNFLNEAVGLFCPNINLKDEIISPLLAEKESLSKLPKTSVITCGKDMLLSHGKEYAEKLNELGVDVDYRFYPEALHGFLEVNRVEAEGDERASAEQLEMTKDCEKYIAEFIKRI